MFVPRVWRPESQEDRPIPIGGGQVTTQPSLVAKMVEALGLFGDETVLEIGTGLGYQAAILAQLARHVVTVERLGQLAEEARRNLASAGIENVRVITGDGAAGYLQDAPYDAVIVGAAAPTVPTPLVVQLSENGRLVQPIGPGGAEIVTVFTKRHGSLAEPRRVTGAYFVPFVGWEAHAPPAGDGPMPRG